MDLGLGTALEVPATVATVTFMACDVGLISQALGAFLTCLTGACCVCAETFGVVDSPRVGQLGFCTCLSVCCLFLITQKDLVQSRHGKKIDYSLILLFLVINSGLSCDWRIVEVKQKKFGITSEALASVKVAGTSLESFMSQQQFSILRTCTNPNPDKGFLSSSCATSRKVKESMSQNLA